MREIIRRFLPKKKDNQHVGVRRSSEMDWKPDDDCCSLNVGPDWCLVIMSACWCEYWILSGLTVPDTMTASYSSWDDSSKHEAGNTLYSPRLALSSSLDNQQPSLTVQIYWIPARRGDGQTSLQAATVPVQSSLLCQQCSSLHSLSQERLTEALINYNCQFSSSYDKIPLTFLDLISYISDSQCWIDRWNYQFWPGSNIEIIIDLVISGDLRGCSDPDGLGKTSLSCEMWRREGGREGDTSHHVTPRQSLITHRHHLNIFHHRLGLPGLTQS